MSRPSHYNSRYKLDLSPRQREVLDLIAAGKTNAEIADLLGLSLDGAKWHVREVLAKLGVESREEAAAWWKRHQRPHARAARAVTGLFSLGAWKVLPATAAVGGVAVLGLGAAALFASGIGSTNDDAEPPACEPEDMRWETSSEQHDGSVTVTLRIGLREADWYEGIMKALQISDRKVESPCLLRTSAGVELIAAGSLPDAPPNLDPVPVVPLGRIENATGSPGVLELDQKLRSGPASSILTVTVSNWCGSGRVGLDTVIPARREGATGPMEHQSLTVEIDPLPECDDPATPAILSLRPTR